jgi:hypothetical protein
MPAEKRIHTYVWVESDVNASKDNRWDEVILATLCLFPLRLPAFYMAHIIILLLPIIQTEEKSIG